MQRVVDGSSTLKDEITAYSEEVVKRGADEVITSRQNALMLFNYDDFMNSPVMRKGLDRTDLSSH